MTNPHRWCVRIGIATLTIAAACSSGEQAAPDSTVASRTPPAPTTTSTAPTTSPPASTTSVAPTSSAVTTTTLPAIPRQPLTGVPLADGEQAILRPALAVKIDNHSAARRNHSGLAVADIVFEEIVEAEITRFAAVFHSRDSDVVGPIRSGRSQDVDLLTSFGSPLFAWSGGNAGVTRLIAESGLTDLNAVRGGEGYYRGPGPNPHDLYNSTQRLWDQTPIFHPAVPPPQQFGYLRPGQTFEGEPVGAVALPMRSIDVLWSWDAESGRFLRSQEGTPHVDALHGRIGAENVLVLSTWYRPSAIDARSPEAQTITESAPLWVFSNGQMIEGRWYRTDATEPIRLVDADFRPIALTPGTTWVELAEAQFTGDAGAPVTDLTILPPG
ncbi:MAG: DUF3048 domain-containing protein [Ilumatobacter sp.]|nr:DUF3048 domain-containing protein [Ilumatobacter sp.]